MNITLGEFIRHKRLTETDITLRQFALILDRSASFVSKVERGMEIPSPMVIKGIAAVLKVDADELLALAGKIDPDLEAAIVANPRLVKRIRQELYMS